MLDGPQCRARPCPTARRLGKLQEGYPVRPCRAALRSRPVRADGGPDHAGVVGLGRTMAALSSLPATMSFAPSNPIPSAKAPSPDLTDAEFAELDDLLAATPEPLEPLDAVMLDGYLCGVIVQPVLLEPADLARPRVRLRRHAAARRRRRDVARSHHHADPAPPCGAEPRDRRRRLVRPAGPGVRRRTPARAGCGAAKSIRWPGAELATRSRNRRPDALGRRLPARRPSSFPTWPKCPTTR